MFKLWKQTGLVDEWRTTDPWRILCEIYAKLLALLVQHWLILVGCWQHPAHSLTQASQTIRKQAWHLASVLHDFPGVCRAIEDVQFCLSAGCRISKSQTTPRTFQRLLQLPCLT